MLSVRLVNLSCRVSGSHSLDKEEGNLKCVMRIWDFKRVGIEIADGMEVKVSGTARITKSYGSLVFGLIE